MSYSMNSMNGGIANRGTSKYTNITLHEEK